MQELFINKQVNNLIIMQKGQEENTQFYQILYEANDKKNQAYKKRNSQEFIYRNSLKIRLGKKYLTFLEQAKQKNNQLEVYSICNQLLKFDEEKKDIKVKQQQNQFLLTKKASQGVQIRQQKLKNVYKRISSQKPIEKYYRVVVLNEDKEKDNKIPSNSNINSEKSHELKIEQEDQNKNYKKIVSKTYPYQSTYSQQSFIQNNNQRNIYEKKQLTQTQTQNQKYQNTLNKCFSGLTITSKNTQATDTNRSQIVQRKYQKYNNNNNNGQNFVIQDKKNYSTEGLQDQKQKNNLNSNNLNQSNNHSNLSNLKLKTKTTLQMLYQQQNQSKNKYQLQQQQTNSQRKQKNHSENILYSSFVIDQKEHSYQKDQNQKRKSNQNLNNFQMTQSRILDFYVYATGKSKSNVKKLILEEVPLGYEEEYGHQSAIISETDLLNHRYQNKAKQFIEKPHKKVLQYKNKLVSLFELKNSQSESDLHNNRSHSQRSASDINQFFKFGIQTQSKIFDHCQSGNSNQKSLKEAKEDLDYHKIKLYQLKSFKSQKKSTASLKLSQTKLQALQEEDYFQNVPKFKEIKALKKSCHPRPLQNKAQEQKTYLNLPPLQKFKFPSPTAQQTPRFGKIISFQQQMKKKKLCSSIVETQPQLMN